MAAYHVWECVVQQWLGVRLTTTLLPNILCSQCPDCFISHFCVLKILNWIIDFKKIVKKFLN